MITFSPYQANQRGLICKLYSTLDIQIEKEKLQKAVKRDNKAFIKLYKQNIEFIIRQINQQNMEYAKWN